jgi:hypothetical protein
VATAPQVCGLLLLPERIDALTAVSLTIGKIRRRYGLTAGQIARSLKNEDGTSPVADTIERAERRENLISMDLAAQLGYLYEDCADPIRRLFDPAISPDPVTAEDRLQRAEQEILAVRRELAAMEDRR